MELSHMGRLVALMTTVIFVLGGCGGAGTTVPQGATTQSRAHQVSGSSGALAYVNMDYETYILTYPGLNVVGKMRGFWGEDVASDPNNGNVFLGLSEFAHGATKPFATLSLASGEEIGGAAFDPTTDNIAFTLYNLQRQVWVSVYQTLYSQPTNYYDSQMSGIGKLGYDGDGNLFVIASGSSGGIFFAELPKGSSTFINFPFNRELEKAFDIGWDGQYLVIRTGSVLNRVTVSGSTMTIVGQTQLKDSFNLWWHTFGVQGGFAIGSHLGPKHHNGEYLGLWSYPQGGKASKIVRTLSKNQKDRVISATVSVAPSQKLIP
jgi:hypothetical protein